VLPLLTAKNLPVYLGNKEQASVVSVVSLQTTLILRQHANIAVLLAKRAAWTVDYYAVFYPYTFSE